MTLFDWFWRSAEKNTKLYYTRNLDEALTLLSDKKKLRREAFIAYCVYICGLGLIAILLIKTIL